MSSFDQTNSGLFATRKRILELYILRLIIYRLSTFKNEWYIDKMHAILQ
jgi:hypothetical protein